MNMTDPIADMLTRIRNAATARHNRVLVPASKMKLGLARVLKEEGYIKDIEILKDNPQGTIRLTLRYVDKKPVLTQLKRVSKPGLRVYTKKARDSPCPWRPGRCRSFNTTRPDDWFKCLQARSWWRGHLLRLVEGGSNVSYWPCSNHRTIKGAGELD